MDKKSVIGFILMGLVLVGFTIFQSKQAEQQLIERRKQEAISLARRDSLAAIEAAKMPEKVEENSVVEQKHEEEHIYKDASLDARKRAEGQIIRLANDKLELEINTKGAQLWSARLKDYSNYGGSDLYLFKAGDNHYDVSVYVGEFIQTQNFTFDVASCSDSLAVLRMPFENGGYIEQVYSLSAGSYMVNSELAFVNMTNIPRQVNSIDVDFETVIPRMEKGYKNESQYSKLN